MMHPKLQRKKPAATVWGDVCGCKWGSLPSAPCVWLNQAPAASWSSSLLLCKNPLGFYPWRVWSASQNPASKVNSFRCQHFLQTVELGRAWPVVIPSQDRRKVETWTRFLLSLDSYWCNTAEVTLQRCDACNCLLREMGPTDTLLVLHHPSVWHSSLSIVPP